MQLKEIQELVANMANTPDPRPADVRDYPRKPHNETQYYRFIYELTRALKPKIVIELGTRRGESAMQFASASKLTQILTVDIDETAREYVRKLNRPNVRSIITPSERALNEVKIWAPWDVLFIDTNHTYEQATREYALYAPLVKKGGIILLDDIHINPGMDRFWNEIKDEKLELNHLHIKGFGLTIRS